MIDIPKAKTNLKPKFMKLFLLGWSDLRDDYRRVQAAEILKLPNCRHSGGLAISSRRSQQRVKQEKERLKCLSSG